MHHTRPVDHILVKCALHAASTYNGSGQDRTRLLRNCLSRADPARDQYSRSSRAVPVARAYTRQMAKVHTRQEGYSVVVHEDV